VCQICACMVRQVKHPCSFTVTTFKNVRTLVQADGDICTGMSRPGGRKLMVD